METTREEGRLATGLFSLPRSCLTRLLHVRQAGCSLCLPSSEIPQREQVPPSHSAGAVRPPLEPAHLWLEL